VVYFSHYKAGRRKSYPPLAGFSDFSLRMDKMGRIVKLKLTPPYPSPAGEGKKKRRLKSAATGNKK